VGVIPSSPRLRRRLRWLGVGVAAGVAIAAVALLVPSPKQPNPNPPKNAPPAKLASHSTYVSPAERKAINKTLDQFIPAALDRRSPATAWRLAGPELTSGSSLREWRAGNSPIPYYPARGKTFHGWTTIDSGRGYVVFNLLVHPLHGAKESAWVFSGEMIKRHSHWLVNRLYTIAILARPTKSGRHEVGPADFAAGPAQSGVPVGTSGVIGKTWLLPVVGVIALVFLVPLGFGIAALLRARRQRRLYRRPEDRFLPPLPRSADPEAEPPRREPVGGGRH
jgi:hypothetical protein